MIDTAPGVAESAVIRKPEAAVSLKELIVRAKELLANYKVPKLVLFVGDLPRNTPGKIQKNLLRATFKDLATPGR